MVDRREASDCSGLEVFMEGHARSQTPAGLDASHTASVTTAGEDISVKDYSNTMFYNLLETRNMYLSSFTPRNATADIQLMYGVAFPLAQCLKSQ